MLSTIAVMLLVYAAALGLVYLVAVRLLALWLLPTAEVQAARDARRAAKVEAYNLARLIETYR